MNKIILSADSTCDLNQELTEKYNVYKAPYTIVIGKEMFKDNVDVTPSDIYKAYSENKVLPKTTAINISEYYNYFKPWIDDGYEVIHITLGSVLTSSYNNCSLAAKELEGVYTIDSQNLSVGTGLLVMKAAEMIEEGLSAKEIVEELKIYREKIHMSFILNTLEFLHAGGRCSKISSLGANVLKIKPVINVDNSSGSMSLGNKYRGALDKSIVKYIKDKISSDNINTDRIFIVHSGIEDSYIELAKNTIKELMDFKHIHITTASCTISSHCGPNTLGIAFETK
ncbi:MAG: DegV family protein [Tissierellaceae bacterium]|nr:DegV family protein [Tissierellaceae bacterium]